MHKRPSPSEWVCTHHPTTRKREVSAKDALLAWTIAAGLAIASFFT
ncbi:MAG: hypothetical protein AAF645_27090 [Myxococcota bacterium]